jgi:hypothetical protein
MEIRSWPTLLLAGILASAALPARIALPADDDKTVRTFHIGNSLTDTVDGWLGPVAKGAGRKLDFHRFTIPGAPTDWLWDHPGTGFGDSRYAEAFAKLVPIDHIFTQPFAGHNRSIPNEADYSARFFNLCRKHSPGVQAWLYVQWPTPKFNDAWAQGKGATVELRLKPAQTWQEGVANHTAYTEAVARLINNTYEGKPVRIVPGGAALAALKTEIDAGRVPGMTNFFAETFADDIHLKPKGRYLIALVHYACIYRESPEGKVSALTTELTQEQAAIFQRIAWQVVRDYAWTGVSGQQPAGAAEKSTGPKSGELTAAMVEAIEKAAPEQAPAKPARPRKCSSTAVCRRTRSHERNQGYATRTVFHRRAGARVTRTLSCR